MKHQIQEQCPNCKIQDSNITPMPDGTCGVCEGTGYIILTSVGKIVTDNSSKKEN